MGLPHKLICLLAGCIVSCAQEEATEIDLTTVEPEILTTQQWDLGDLPHRKGAPDYYLFDHGTSPPSACFRGSFNGSLYVHYYDKNDNLKRTINNFTMNSTVDGGCGHNTAELKLSWGGQMWDTHSLTFLFVKTPKNTNDEFSMETWLVSLITFRLDLGSEEFDHPKVARKMVVETGANETHFQTPLGMSYACQSHNKIELDAYNHADNEKNMNHDYIREIYLDIWNVRIQPFELEPHGQYSRAAPCALDIENLGLIQTKHIIPIAITAMLCAVLLIMVVTYFYMRRSKSNKAYTPMQ